MRLIALATLVLLAGCSPSREAEIAAEPVVVGEPAVSGALYEKDCAPGDDDGIGGTGCKVD
jgi:hypothetical protein